MKYPVFTCIFSCAHQGHASDPWKIPCYATCTISSYAMSLNTTSQNAGSNRTYEGIISNLVLVILIVLATAFSMTWYKGVIQRSLMVYECFSIWNILLLTYISWV